MQESFTIPTDEEIHAKLSQIREKNKLAEQTSNWEESARLLKEALAETIRTVPMFPSRIGIAHFGVCARAGMTQYTLVRSSMLIHR
jgi:hypothetical protein